MTAESVFFAVRIRGAATTAAAPAATFRNSRRRMFDDICLLLPTAGSIRSRAAATSLSRGREPTDNVLPIKFSRAAATHKRVAAARLEYFSTRKPWARAHG